MTRYLVVFALAFCISVTLYLFADWFIVNAHVTDVTEFWKGQAEFLIAFMVTWVLLDYTQDD